MEPITGRLLAQHAALDVQIQDVASARSLSERFQRLRHNYAVHQRRVDAGISSWMRGDPYELADWLSVFTPIESAAWTDIRGAGLPLWPQLPVGRFFVDFGNPVKRIALECDGRQWHDASKDAKRDAQLLDLGWQVFRAPGWQCMAPDTEPAERTMKAVIGQIKQHF